MSVTVSERGLTRSVPISTDAYQWVALFGVCVVGLGLRLWGLTTESIWLDEATSLNIARMPLAELLRYLATQDVHPPLYFVLLHVWQALGTDAFTLRLLSAILGVLTLPVVYGLGRELLDWRVGLIAALWLAVSPLHIYYSQMVRMYALWVLVATIGWYAMVRAIRTGQPRWWGLYTAATAAALYTHSFSLLTWGAQSALGLMLTWRDRSSRAQLRAWLIANAGVVLLIVPWLPALWAQQGGGGPGWLSALTPPTIGEPATTWSKYTLGEAAGDLPRVLRWVSYALSGLLVASALFQRRRGFPYVAVNRDKGAWVTLAYLVLPVIGVWIISQVKPLYVTRYLLPFLIPYLLILAMGVVRLGPALARYGVALGLLGVMLGGVWVQYATLQVDDWQTTTALVLAQARPDDSVIFSPVWYAAPFDYYAQGRGPRPVAMRADLAEPEKACRIAATIPGRLWLVKPYRAHWSDPDDRLVQCLGASRASLEVYRFNRGDGAIVLYAAP